jgi:hypothetical protein
MPTYHFVSNDGLVAFGVQRELSCTREAKYEAVEFLWERLRDVSGEFWTRESVTIIVTDAWHVELFTLKLDLRDTREARLHCVT